MKKTQEQNTKESIKHYMRKCDMTEEDLIEFKEMLQSGKYYLYEVKEWFGISERCFKALRKLLDR